MKKLPLASSPEAYVNSLSGWPRTTVEELRRLIRTSRSLEERLKWGHLVYFSTGPILLIRAEANRVLFGFWRGQRLHHLEARLKPGGKYEMATLELHEGDTVTPSTVSALVKEAIALNQQWGDPTEVAKRR